MKMPTSTSKNLLLFLLFTTTNMSFPAGTAATPTTNAGSCPSPRIRNGKAEVKAEGLRNGRAPNGSEALVSCEAGYGLRDGGEWIYCRGGKWVAATEAATNYPYQQKGAKDFAAVCERTQETRCGPVPAINNGYYRPFENSYSDSKDYSVGTLFQANCHSSYTLNCPHQQSCGRLQCHTSGKWVPVDGHPISCIAANPQTVVSGTSRDVRLEDVHGPRNTSSTQNYLILVLALVCIIGVAVLTIALLRRPILFCKKRDQSNQDPQVIVTSSSPHHGMGGMGGGEDLDSIPVAMNTGIFIPGADYNLQDYTLQDGPLCGTHVFK